jgi:hypothetical protein
MAHTRLAWNWLARGKYEKAIEELRLSYPPDSRGSLGGEKAFHRLKDTYATRGTTDYWRESLAKALEGYKPGAHYGTDTIAAIYPRLGETGKALDWLEEGYAVHDPYLIFGIAVSPEYDSIRSLPRFQKLLHGLGLPGGAVR